MKMNPTDANDVQRFFLHLPEGDRMYVCIFDEQRGAFDFTDNTFKGRKELGLARNAFLPATGHYEPRADHEYSYRVEFDLARLFMGTNPETIPAEGAKVTVRWLRQVGDEPDESAEMLLANSVSLQNVSGRFHLIESGDACQFDENLAFEKREKDRAAYREFVLREMDTIEERQERLVTVVRSGNVASVLRVLAEDLCYWAGNLKRHFFHQVSRYAKDPTLVRLRMVPKDAPYQFYEHWVVRDWIGSAEAYDLLEFHKSVGFARSFSARLKKLHEARIQFSLDVVEYTVRTLGEDPGGVIELDKARKNLKHHALRLAEYFDVIALQFDATDLSKRSQERQTRPIHKKSRQNDEHQTPGSTSESTAPVVSIRPVLRRSGQLRITGRRVHWGRRILSGKQPQVSDVREPQQFHGGEVVFFEDRVEICGVDVCSGPRCGSRRIVLELLSRQKSGMTFVAYSGEELESQAKTKGAKGTAGGWIRDLRDEIIVALRTRANIISGQRDVILSGGPGYRFAECLTIRYDSPAAITDITDMAEPEDVRDDDVRDVFDIPDDEAARRRGWIVQQIQAGVRLKAPMVAARFKRTKKTAQRDLDALRDEGKIEFVGDPRTGYYRLVAGK